MRLVHNQSVETKLLESGNRVASADVGQFVELEDELAAFSTFGYTGQGSPNRADAWVWVLAELFPGLVKAPKPTLEMKREATPNIGWMAG